MLTCSDSVVYSLDFYYIGQDCHSFVRCCLCHCYTPFIFYVVSKKALEMIAKILPPQHNFFCVNCLPKPRAIGNGADELYPSDSLLNNEDFLSMFEGYECYNPYYYKFSTNNHHLSCLIITEHSKIYSNYKNIARKPLPTTVKIRKLFELFPPVHQMEFRKYASMVEMYTELRKKYRAICTAYTTSSSRPFYDDIDMLVDRTPFRSQTVRDQSRGSVAQSTTFPTDTLLMRTQGSDQLSSVGESDVEEATSVQFSSQSLNDEGQRQLQLPESQQSTPQSILSSQDVQSPQPSFDSIDVSSQNIELEPILPLSESIRSISPNISIASSVSSVLPARIRPLQGFSDSQEAGPSGLQQLQQQQQQQEEQESTRERPPAKRRRMSAIPVNPTPEEAQLARGSRVRLPRMPGG